MAVSKEDFDAERFPRRAAQVKALLA